MSEISRDMNTSADSCTGPDLFQYYIRGLSDLLDGDDIPLSSRFPKASANKSIKNKEVVKEVTASNDKNHPSGFGSLFSNAVGDGLSVVQKASLKAMLRQSVIALTREVDEMLDPVFSINRLRALLAPKKSCSKSEDANCESDTENRAHKRLKGSQNDQKGMLQEKLITRCQNKGCANFSEMDKYTQKSNHNESKTLCGDCAKQANGSLDNKNESFLGSSCRDDKENGEVNDDLQVLLVNNGPKVAEKMEKHSAELSATLGSMGDKLEELLDVINRSCRPMTLVEKHKLCQLIEKLPPKNLDRVAEIVQRKNPSGSQSSNEIFVELQQEDDVTLWRLYHYVKAVESAQKLILF